MVPNLLNYIYISIDLSCFPLFLPQVFQTWIAGDINLDLELQSAISEKSPQFGFGDLTVFKDLVQEHVSSSEKKMAALGKSGPTIQAAQLERQAFDIVLSNIRHDLEVYKVWFTRNQDRQAAFYFQELQHKQARKAQALEAAKSLSDRGSPAWRVKLCNLEEPAQCLQEFQAMRRQIMKLETLSAKDQVLPLVVLNWAAPSSFTSQQQCTQSALAGSLVNAEGGFGCILTPVFFHKKGQVYKLEERANSLLSEANINSDARFALPFTGRNDDREKRTHGG